MVVGVFAAQVHGDHRPQRALHLVAALEQQPTQRPGRESEDHVVHRAAEGALDGLHVVER